MVEHAGANHRFGRFSNRFPAIHVLAVLSLALVANVVLGQSPPPAGKEPPAKPAAAAGPSAVANAEIQQAVADLGSADFSVRERATEKLWRAGAAAEPALQKAVRETEDFEIASRAQQLLQSFQLGIYADTPPETVALIRQFRAGNYMIKQNLVQLARQRGTVDLVQRLIAKETNPALRQQLNQILANTDPARQGANPFSTVVARGVDAAGLAQRARQRLVQTGNFDSAELLLRRGTSDESIRDYAALLLSRNKLNATIAQLRVGLAATDLAGQRRLAWMLRANGDLPGAVAAARLTKDNELVQGLLAELADWKELARTDAKADCSALAANDEKTQSLARIMVFRHLAGEKDACDVAAAATLKAWKMRNSRDGQLLGALLLCDRANQVIEACTAQKPQVAFELLVCQSRMREAFKLVKLDVPIPNKFDWTAWLEDGKAPVDRERLQLAMQVLRSLRLAGEDQPARDLTAAMLEAIGKKLGENGGEMVALSLMGLEVEVGRADTADELAVKLLALDLKNPESVVYLLHHRQSAMALLLWKALRKQFPGEDRPAALKHLRRLLEDKPDAAAVAELRRLLPDIESQIGALDTEESPDDESSDPEARKLLALATLCHRYGDSKLTDKYLARITPACISARTLIDRGNLYADEKQWTEAIASYKAAWNKTGHSASALYLQGWAQTKGGDEAEGRKQMEIALAIPLGDGESRRDLAQTLARLHQDEEAARQRQWVLRLAGLHDRSIVQVLMETGDAALEKPDKTGMTTVWQRVCVELLGGSVFFNETRYYCHPPTAAHDAHTSELLAAGKTAEALEELHQAEAAQPRDIQLALDSDPGLRKRGAAAEADALYQRMLQRHEELLHDFPRSALYHNDLAWLAANLDRDLDKALVHARKAVELDPQSAGILDTLAEVHFRRGNRAEAARLAKRCLEIDPDGEHYKKQLARFEAK